MSRALPKILVVDDDKNIIRLLQVNLESIGCKVIKAMNGNEALEKIKSEHPDMVISDVIMPYINGFDLLESVRRDPETADLPFILLTAMSAQSELHRGWRSGVDMYLTKPFNPAILLSTVKRIFRSQTEQQQGVYQLS